VDDFSADIENQCTPVEKLNEFAACQQGCEEIFPKAVNPIDNNGGNNDPDDYDISVFERTDAIGVAKEEKRCGTRDFDEIKLPENEAIMGEFPWVCSLFTQGIGGKREKYLGGCTIVPNERDNDIQKPTYRVITAASKVKLARDDPLKIRVRFTNQKNGNFEEDHLVSRFITHPGFKKNRLLHNIAILVLDEPIDLVREEGVNAACIPNCNGMFDHTFKNDTGVRCWSAGFGAQEKNGPQEFVLRKVDIPIYPDKTKCEKVINDAFTQTPGRKGRRIRLNAGEVCFLSFH
jgi:hypothetical protein